MKKASLIYFILVHIFILPSVAYSKTITTEKECKEAGGDWGAFSKWEAANHKDKCVIPARKMLANPVRMDRSVIQRSVCLIPLQKAESVMNTKGTKVAFHGWSMVSVKRIKYVQTNLG
jgi:hypothetical protein